MSLKVGGMNWCAFIKEAITVLFLELLKYFNEI